MERSSRFRIDRRNTKETRNWRSAWRWSSHLHRAGSVVGIFSRVASVCPGDVKRPTWNVRPAGRCTSRCTASRSPPNGSLLPTFFSTIEEEGIQAPLTFLLLAFHLSHPSPIPPTSSPLPLILLQIFPSSKFSSFQFFFLFFP